MFTWLKDLFGDNGESNEAVTDFRRERQRSKTVKGDLDGMAERLAASRDAVTAKFLAVQEKERASVTDIKPPRDSLPEAECAG